MIRKILRKLLFFLIIIPIVGFAMVLLATTMIFISPLIYLLEKDMSYWKVLCEILGIPKDAWRDVIAWSRK